MENQGKDIYKMAEEYSGKFNKELPLTAVILAAGHGKRIKSQTSKMLHKIWQTPTVERVLNACVKGIQKLNVIIVVGIKAECVIEIIGKRENVLYAYQSEQLGTGHALQVAAEKIPEDYSGSVIVLPGDMGLIDAETVADFVSKFEKSSADMMALTGIYEGEPEKNYYGRILRVKEIDARGNSTESDAGKVIEIIEHKDILALPEEGPYIAKFGKREIAFTREELLNANEYNSGVFAFKFPKLKDFLYKIESNNAQNEIYITDLIAIFNRNNLTVEAVFPEKQYVIMGFNNKSVLKKMEAIARQLAYEKIKDLVEIDDPDDFFVADEVIEKIIEMDKLGQPLDIRIGKGAFIGRNVKINYNLSVGAGAYVDGNVSFGKNVKLYERVYLNTYPNQQIVIGDNVEILWDDIIKGNVQIGDYSRIESSVNMTGSDEFPLRIGKNVIIKGTSYLFGTKVEDGIFIEHSILIKKIVKRYEDAHGNVMPVRFYVPYPEGVEAIESIS